MGGGWDTSNWMGAGRFTLRDFVAVGNPGPGIWFDIDNTDILIERAVVVGNRRRGIFLQASPSPMALTDSIILHTQPAPAGDPFRYMSGLKATIYNKTSIKSSADAGRRPGASPSVG